MPSNLAGMLGLNAQWHKPRLPFPVESLAKDLVSFLMLIRGARNLVMPTIHIGKGWLASELLGLSASFWME